MPAEGKVIANGESGSFGGALVQNATGTGIEVRVLDDGTVEIARCCIKVKK